MQFLVKAYDGPDMLEKRMAVRPRHLEGMKALGRQIIAAGGLLDEDGKMTGRVIPVKERLTYRDLLWHNQINCSSVVMLTKVARRFPMAHEDSHEDYITWMQILSEYDEVCAVNEPLLRYRVSNKGKSGSKLRSAVMTYKAYRYMGFGPLKSAALFVSYAVNGVIKYTRA